MPSQQQEVLLARPRSKNFPGTSSNHNVVMNWMLKVSTGMADSIWSKTVLASYLYELMGQSNSYAGYVEAAQGIASLVVALPVGWLADRGSKSRIIAAGGALLPVAVAATSYAVIYGVEHQDEKRSSFVMFMGALSLWGAVQSIQNGPAQALYADSTAAGERSRYYMISYVLYLCASVLGPVAQHVDSAMQLQRHGSPPSPRRGARPPGSWLRPAALTLTLSLTVTATHARRAAGPVRAREGRLRGAAAARPCGVAEVGRPARRW